MQLFHITIGPRDAPRLAFQALAADSASACAQHIELALPGERVEITAVVRADEQRDDVDELRHEADAERRRAARRRREGALQ